MKLRYESAATMGTSDADSVTETNVHGRWLFLARPAWVVLALLVLGLNVGAIPHYHAVLQMVCSASANCFGNQLTSGEVQELHASGGSLSAFATFTVVVQSLTMLVWVMLGALLLWRRSDEPLALFCSFMLVTFGGASITSMLQVGLEPLSIGWYAVCEFLDFFGQVSFFLFFYLFPTGQFVPRWTRWTALLYAVYCAWTIFTFHSGGVTSTSEAIFYFALILTAVVAQVYRYLRVSTLGQRHQTKWVMLGFILVIVSFISLFTVGAVLSAGRFFLFFYFNGNTIVNMIFLLIPSSIAIAVLRSRLWDIDIIINKALVYGLLTTLLVAVYAGLIIGLESLIELFTTQNAQPFVLVITTLAIAALFQPLRGRIQQVIDRRFYRHKYDAARTLAAFSATLRDELDVSQLSEQLVMIVQDTMQPTHISLWLRPPEQDRKHPLTRISRSADS